MPQEESENGFQNDMSFMMNTILNDFTIATAEVSVRSEMVNFVMMGHTEALNWNESHTQALLMIITDFPHLIESFAKKSRLFRTIRMEDQLILLRHNASLYIHYILARYCAADTGLEQLDWVLGPNLGYNLGKLLIHLLLLCLISNLLTLQLAMTF